MHVLWYYLIQYIEGIHVFICAPKQLNNLPCMNTPRKYTCKFCGQYWTLMVNLAIVAAMLWQQQAIGHLNADAVYKNF